MAKNIAQLNNIEIFKGPRNLNADYFKIFFFNRQPLSLIHI